MDQIIRFAAYFASLVQLVFVVTLIPQTSGMDLLALGLLFFPPILTAIALYAGPDMEERRLGRQLNKARMKHELIALGVGRSAKKAPPPENPQQ